MRKFKLIKKYPGSPELNFVVTYGDFGLNGFCYQGTDLKTISRFSKEHIEDNPEFWEEILDEDNLKLTTEDYEILSFKIPGNEHWEVTKIGNGTWDNWSDLHVKTQLEKGIWKIKRVKRLSDGTVFSIGDEVEYFVSNNKYIFQICGFVLTKNERIVLSSQNYVYHVDLFSNKAKYIDNCGLIHSKKQPVLIAQDCVEVFEGDEYYTVCENSYNISINTATKDCVKKLNNKTKIFSTKEKADNYIIWNKPMLSLKEIAGIYPGINKNHANTPSHQAELLKKLAEGKYYNR